MKAIGELMERNIKLVGADALSQRGFVQVPIAILRSGDLSMGAKMAYPFHIVQLIMQQSLQYRPVDWSPKMPAKKFARASVPAVDLPQLAKLQHVKAFPMAVWHVSRLHKPQDIGKRRTRNRPLVVAVWCIQICISS